MGLLNGFHALEKVACHIADGKQFDVTSAAASIQMSDLRDWSGADHADSQKALFLMHENSILAVGVIRILRWAC
jgi:hypothetical protein